MIFTSLERKCRMVWNYSCLFHPTWVCKPSFKAKTCSLGFSLCTCFLSLSSRWSILTRHSSISALELKIWLPGCWSTTLCTDCPLRVSFPTPGWLSAPPRSPQPWTRTSPVNEPFGMPPPNMRAHVRMEYCRTSDLQRCETWTSAQLIYQNLPVLPCSLQNHHTDILSHRFLIFYLLTAFPCLTTGMLFACKYFTVLFVIMNFIQLF